MANEKVITLDNLRKFKEKCDEKYSGGGIEIVNEIPEELSDANLNKLYREKPEDNVDNLQVINKEVSPAGDVTSNCITTKNGTQISNYAAFNGYFDTSLNELYGDNFTVSLFTNVYTAYYPNVDGSPVSAIRIGTKNAGDIQLDNLPEGTKKLKLIVGKYFSYNTQTGQKSYDENAVLNVFCDEGTGQFDADFSLEEEATELELDLEELGYIDGPIHLHASGSNIDGRVFLYGFVAEGAESVTYTPKRIAMAEEVAAVEEHVTEVEESVDNAHDRIDDVEINLEETSERIGDIQIWNADRLPRASESYRNMILKVDEKLYQCVKNPKAGYVMADFSACTGTNQIIAANFEDFQRIVGKDFLNEFELVATENTIDFDYVAVEDEADITVGKRYRIALDEMDLEEEYSYQMFDDTRVNNATVLLSNVPKINSLEYEDLPLSNIDYLNIYSSSVSEDDIFYVAVLDNTPDDNSCGSYIDYLDLKINSNEGADYDLSVVPMYDIFTTTVENDPIAYTYKNNGEIRFGSSSNLGYFYLTKNAETATIYVPLTKLVFKVKSWNDSKYSCLKIDFFEKNLDASKSFSIRRLIEPSLEEQEIIITTDDEGNPLSVDLEDYEIKISGDNVHFINENFDELIYADRRVRILSVSFSFGADGEPAFIWQPLGAGEGGGARFEEVEQLPEEGEEGTIYLLPSETGPGGGGGISDDHTVTINGSTISLADFIANCESGKYTSVGTVATCHALISGEDFRIRLIGVNHDVLSVTDEGKLEPSGTTAKTTWQFVDMPLQKVNLGLQFMDNDCDVGWEGFYREVPSNLHGYGTAVSLLNAIQEVYNSLPIILQNAMKMVRKDIYIPVLAMAGWDYEDYDSTASYIRNEGDRYGSCINAKLFCLSATEVGIIPDDDETQHFPYSCIWHNWDTDEDEEIMLEGKKYAYFNETKAYVSEPESDRRRPAFYRGENWYYWLRSPYLDNSDHWGYVDGYGYVNDDYTHYDYGLAPAFCI